MATTPVLLPEKSHGQRSLVDYSPRGLKELDTTECAHTRECMCIPSPPNTHMGNIRNEVILRGRQLVTEMSDYSTPATMQPLASGMLSRE